MVDAPLKDRVIYQALVFIRTVEFLDKEVKRTIREIEIAEKTFDTNGEEKGRSKLRQLLKKLDKEDKAMGEFVEKYGKILYSNEKEESLPNLGKKEQVYLRSIPANSRGERSGGKIQEKARKEKR
jgi:hypothetical protein